MKKKQFFLIFISICNFFSIKIFTMLSQVGNKENIFYFNYFLEKKSKKIKKPNNCCLFSDEQKIATIKLINIKINNYFERFLEILKKLDIQIYNEFVVGNMDVIEFSESENKISNNLNMDAYLQKMKFFEDKFKQNKFLKEYEDTNKENEFYVIFAKIEKLISQFSEITKTIKRVY